MALTFNTKLVSKIRRIYTDSTKVLILAFSCTSSFLTSFGNLQLRHKRIVGWVDVTLESTQWEQALDLRVFSHFLSPQQLLWLLSTPGDEKLWELVSVSTIDFFYYKALYHLFYITSSLKWQIYLKLICPLLKCLYDTKVWVFFIKRSCDNSSYQEWKQQIPGVVESFVEVLVFAVAELFGVVVLWILWISLLCILKSSLLVKPASHFLQFHIFGGLGGFGVFGSFSWTLMWTRKVYASRNTFPQRLQAWRKSLLCHLICLPSLPDVMKRLSHWLHAYGRSPVCIRIWSRNELFE